MDHSSGDRSYYLAARNALLSFLLFTAAFGISVLLGHRARQKYFSRDSTFDALPFYLSLLLITVALLWMLLAVLVVVLELQLDRFVFLYFLTDELVSDFWGLIQTSTTISLFLIFPFAYLFYESDGFSIRQRNPDKKPPITARLLETTVVLLLVSVMIYGCFSLLTYFVESYASVVLPVIADNTLSGIFTRHLAIHSSGTFTLAHTSISMMLYALAYYHGIFDLYYYTLQCYQPWHYSGKQQHVLSQRIEMMELELACLTRQINYNKKQEQHVGGLELIRTTASLYSHQEEEKEMKEVEETNNKIVETQQESLERQCTLLQATLVQVYEKRNQMEAKDTGCYGCVNLVQNVTVIFVTMILALLSWYVFRRAFKHEMSLLFNEDGVTDQLLLHGGIAMIPGYLLQSIRVFLNSFGILQPITSNNCLVTTMLNGWCHHACPYASIINVMLDLVIMFFFLVATLVGVFHHPYLHSFSPLLLRYRTDHQHRRRQRTSPASAPSEKATQYEKKKQEDFVLAKAQKLLNANVISLEAFTRMTQPRAMVPSDGDNTVSIAVVSSDADDEQHRTVSAKQFFVMNAVLVLLLTSALPFAAWVIGLGRFQLDTFQPIVASIPNSFLHIYNIMFLVILIWALVEFWQSILASMTLAIWTETVAPMFFKLASLLPSWRAQPPVVNNSDENISVSAANDFSSRSNHKSKRQVPEVSPSVSLLQRPASSLSLSRSLSSAPRTRMKGLSSRDSIKKNKKKRQGSRHAGFDDSVLLRKPLTPLRMSNISMDRVPVDVSVAGWTGFGRYIEEQDVTEVGMSLASWGTENRDDDFMFDRELDRKTPTISSSELFRSFSSDVENTPQQQQKSRRTTSSRLSVNTTREDASILKWNRWSHYQTQTSPFSTKPWRSRNSPTKSMSMLSDFLLSPRHHRVSGLDTSTNSVTRSSESKQQQLHDEKPSPFLQEIQVQENRQMNFGLEPSKSAISQITAWLEPRNRRLRPSLILLSLKLTLMYIWRLVVLIVTSCFNGSRWLYRQHYARAILRNTYDFTVNIGAKMIRAVTRLWNRQRKTKAT